MASILEVILRARNDLSPAVKAATRDIQSLGNAATRAQGNLGASLGRLTENLDRAGNSSRAALSGISQLAGGGGTALGRLTGQAAQTADAIGDISGALSRLSVASIGLSAVSLIFAEWAAVADNNARRIEEVTKPFDTLVARVRELDSGTPLANLAASIGTSTEKLDALIRSSREARGEVLKWIEAERELAKLREQAAIIRQAEADTFGLLNRAAAEGLQLGDIKTFYDGLFSALQNGVGLFGDFDGALAENQARQTEAAAATTEATSALTEQAAAVEGARARWEALNGALLQYAGFSSQASLTANRWADYNTRVANSLGHTDSSLLKTGQTVDQFNAKWERFARESAAKAELALARARAEAERFRSAMTALARGALQPTQVTEEDLGLAALGNYVDKWDELRRQAEDVAITPENISKYAELAKALDQTGLSAAEFARQFRDMSLFADPANLNLVNWNAFTASIRDKIRGMIGEATLMKQAFQEAVASLSPGELAAFTKALNLDPSAAGNVDKLFEAYSGEEADTTKNNLGDMANKIRIIEGTHTSTLTFVWDKAKTAIDQAHDYLQDKILQYADVLIEITARFTPPAPGGAESGGGAATGVAGARASGGYVGNGLYRLGEAGREYVLPHKMVKYIEGVLGGPIRDPDQIGWLIGALERGPQETANQLQMWASGIAGWGVDNPAGATKWIDKVYERYAREHGEGALPAGAQSSSVPTAGAGAGGGGFGEGLPVLRDIAATLHRIEKNTALGATVNINANLDLKDMAKQVSREIGRNAFLRSAMGV